MNRQTGIWLTPCSLVDGFKQFRGKYCLRPVSKISCRHHVATKVGKKIQVVSQSGTTLVQAATLLAYSDITSSSLGGDINCPETWFEVLGGTERNLGTSQSMS